jgi:hypothetical protein
VLKAVRPVRKSTAPSESQSSGLFVVKVLRLSRSETGVAGRATCSSVLKTR